MQRKHGKDDKWIWKAHKDLPLYNLPAILVAPVQQTVVIVEGEKDVESLKELGILGTTNPGGAGKWREAYTRELRERQVVVIADADVHGRKHAKTVFAALQGLAKYCRSTTCPAPHKDVSDYIAALKRDGKNVRQVVAALIRTDIPADAPSKREPEPSESGDEIDRFTHETVAEPTEYYRALGHDHGALYYYSYLTQQVVSASGPKDAESKKLLLAPSHWWEIHCPAKGNAEAMLTSQAINAGVFDMHSIRGRGGWFDAGRIVLHCGTHIICDGKQFDLATFPSEYTYEAGLKYPIYSGNGISNSGAHEFRLLCERIRWTRPVDAAILSGWIVIAPFCGALDWRPHISIAGESGSGKSWIVDNLIRAPLKDIAASFLSSATEAGIRQSLKGDARPVVLDEIEPNTPENTKRIQSILHLARASSSNDEAAIPKGSPSGHVTLFYPRYMFCYSGITEQAVEQADRNRTTVLQPRIIPDDEAKVKHFADLEQEQRRLVTPEFIEGLRARTLAALPTIRANARVFANAWTVNQGNTRTGNQVGTLLAGAYSLNSTREITHEAALAYIREHDWTDEKALQEERDPLKVLQTITRYVVHLTGSFQGDRNIGELIELCMKEYDVEREPRREQADATLQRYGIRVKNEWLAISTKPEFLKPILGHTPWATGHSRLLALLTGAESPESGIRFKGLNVSKVTTIPLSTLAFEEKSDAK